MNYAEFIKKLEQSVACAYLFHGEEEHVKQSMAERLADRALAGGIREMNLLTLEGDVPAGDIIAALEPLPMMGDMRMVWVKNWAPLSGGKTKDEKAELDKILAYLNDPAPHACLLLYQHGAVDAKNKAFKDLGARLDVVEFPILDGRDALKWTLNAAKTRNVTMNREAAEALLLRTGRQLTDVGREMDKLAAYAGAGGTITLAAVDLLVPKTLEFTVFQMVDAIVLRQGQRALEMLWQALSGAEAGMMVAAMLARQLRLSLQALAMQREGVPPQQMERALEAPAFACRKAAEIARSAGERWLSAALSKVIDLDWDIKSGKVRDERLALEVLVLSLVAGDKAG